MKILSTVLFSLTACQAVFVFRAEAYIDPGTSGVVFSSFGYILAAAAAGLGVILYPLRKIAKRLRGRSTPPVKSPSEPSSSSQP